jgi:hypothetical protein
MMRSKEGCVMQEPATTLAPLFQLQYLQLLPKLCFVFVLPPSVPIVGIKCPVTPIDLSSAMQVREVFRDDDGKESSKPLKPW